MNFFINQNITIHTIKIDALTNSSVLQIGSAGIIKPVSNLYNTGGFRAPAPAARRGAITPTPTGQAYPHTPFVPLVSPSG
jgi:spore germination protein PB